MHCRSHRDADDHDDDEFEGGGGIFLSSYRCNFAEAHARYRYTVWHKKRGSGCVVGLVSSFSTSTCGAE